MDLSWINRKPNDITAAVTFELAHKKAALEAIYAVPNDKRTFNDTVAALERASDILNDLQQQLDLMVMVHPDKAIRDAAQNGVETIESANIELDHDRRLWQAVMAWHSHAEPLPPADQKLADDTLRDLRRMGFGLSEDDFELLKSTQKELQKLNQEFERTINEYEDHVELAREQLAGLPERYIEGLRRTKEGKYIVSLQYPEFFPFMELADDDSARKDLAAKSLRNGGPANLERLARMLELRQTIAGLLGYACHADYVQEVCMARNSQTVDGFLSGLIAKLAPKAQKELRELIAEKQRTLGLSGPKPIHFHEVAFWSEKLKKTRYDFDVEQLKEYFPLQNVLIGMLDIYQEVLSLKFERISAQLWHEDAELYSVADAATGKLIGYFILDLYPREGKYGHAATFPAIIGRQASAGTQIPGLMALVCNFPRPTRTNPSLMLPDNEGAETLFHEFGHVVHALVSGDHWQRQNGFGVPIDFVETPSQAFEYWIWDARSLAKIAKHYQTGAPLPKDLMEKFLDSRRHQQASYYLSIAVRALFDLRIHSQLVDAPVAAEKLAEMYRLMKLEYEHIELPEDSLFPAGWGHMADYDAAYYSYLWSKVYAADLFSRFQANPLDATVGREYRIKVLEPGASRPEKQLVEDFLGRPADDQALMAEFGL